MYTMCKPRVFGYLKNVPKLQELFLGINNI